MGIICSLIGTQINIAIAPDFMAPAVTIRICILYTSDAADDRISVDLGGRRIIKKINIVIGA